MIVYEGHTHAALSVAYSPDGKSMISGSSDKTVRIWDAQTPTSIGDPLIGHSDSINSISYCPPGNLIASGSDDKTIRLWDVNTREHLGDPIKGNHQFISVAFSPDAKLIASGCGGYASSGPSRLSVQLWDVRKRAAAASPFQAHTRAVISVQFSPDGNRLVSGSGDNTIRVWDAEHGATVLGPLQGHNDSVFSVAFSPDGSQIVSCSKDKTIRLWDTRSGKTIGNPYEGHTHWVNSVVFSPRDTYLASGGEDKTVRLWDIRTGRQVQLYDEHTGWVSSVAFSPSGQHIASGSHDNKVIIRNILGEDSDLSHPSGPHIITNQMSTQQMFECLTSSGLSGGGFGDIWKDQCDYKTLKRAARELFYWSKMEHLNVHRLQGVIMFRDQYLGMVSEWMDNGNLHDYLWKQPSADRYKLCVHVASGLEYMHSCNTVHGDLKALNVLVSSDGIAKLSDFDFSIMSEASTLVFSESSNSRLGSLRWTVC
ncbi:tyrosine kinase catalytic domain protein, partial [Rhizoctonia solani AG-3 Rhs1AP]